MSAVSEQSDRLQGPDTDSAPLATDKVGPRNLLNRGTQDLEARLPRRSARRDPHNHLEEPVLPLAPEAEAQPGRRRGQLAQDGFLAGGSRLRAAWCGIGCGGARGEPLQDRILERCDLSAAQVLRVRILRVERVPRMADRMLEGRCAEEAYARICVRDERGDEGPRGGRSLDVLQLPLEG